MGRPDGAGTEDDFAFRSRLRATAVFLKADQSGALPFEENVERLHAGANSEIRARSRRMQERPGRTVAPTLALGNLVGAESFLRIAVEIGVALEPALFGGLDEGFRNRIDAAQVGDSQRTADPVVVGRSPLLVLGLLEVGQDVGIAPARISKIAPLVVIMTVAANVDHGVEGTAASQNLAPRPIRIAAPQLRLRLGVISPVTRGFEELGKRRRHMDFLPGILPAGFKEKNLDFRIFRQAVG